MSQMDFITSQLMKSSFSLKMPMLIGLTWGAFFSTGSKKVDGRCPFSKELSLPLTFGGGGVSAAWTQRFVTEV